MGNLVILNHISLYLRLLNSIPNPCTKTLIDMKGWREYKKLFSALHLKAYVKLRLLIVNGSIKSTCSGNLCMEI